MPWDIKVDRQVSKYEVRSLINGAIELDDEIARLKEKLEQYQSSLGKIKPFLTYEDSRFNQDCSDAVFEKAKKSHEANLIIAAENEVIWKNNRAVIDRIVEMAKASGVRTEHLKTKGKWKTVDEDWVTKLYEQAPPLYNNKRQIERVWEDYVSARERYIVVSERALQIEKVKAEQERENIERVKRIGRAQQALGITDNEDPIKFMCRKDPWLNLAVAMKSVREDWSDGCSPVRDALFIPVNPNEDEILKEIESLCDNFEDGRVFRDCIHSYGWILINKVNKEYLQIYEMLS